MTHFESTYLSSRPHRLAISFSDGNNEQSKEYQAMQQIEKGRQELKMQLEYRELDRLAMQLEKELKACQALRMELEKLKIDFSITVENEATKKIQEVVKSIDKILK